MYHYIKLKEQDKEDKDARTESLLNQKPNSFINVLSESITKACR